MKTPFFYIAGIHGNEPLPLFALTSKRFKVLAGNPKALMKNRRFIHQDLNASFGIKNASYESKRAKQLLELIPVNSTVIDFHTTSAQTEPFAIIVDKKLIPIALKTGLKHIVYMNYNIKSGHSLLNYRDGISVEVGNHSSLSSIKLTLDVVHSLENHHSQQKVYLYEVFDVIDQKGEYKNFKMSKEGFFPVLAGEKSYPFFGLKAKQIMS